MRQIRDYQPGDSFRTIHWKQSARTDTLMVREYAKEGKRSLTVTLDMERPKPLPPAQRNAFYEVVQSLLLGLTAREVLVQLWWNHREGTDCFQVSGEEDCREALLRLYETGGFFSGEKKGLPQEGFWLDSSLTLSFREEKIFAFSPKNYENELKMPMDWREIHGLEGKKRGRLAGPSAAVHRPVRPYKDSGGGAGTHLGHYPPACGWGWGSLPFCGGCTASRADGPPWPPWEFSSWEASGICWEARTCKDS